MVGMEGAQTYTPGREGFTDSNHIVLGGEEYTDIRGKKDNQTVPVVSKADIATKAVLNNNRKRSHKKKGDRSLSYVQDDEADIGN
jgi:hypothetical protein